MTEEKAILATRKHFADNCDACIKQATEGIFKVNDLPKYIKWQTELKEHINAGLSDNTFTHLQYKNYLLTGEMIALLP